MIKTKSDLKFFLQCDKVSLKVKSKKKFPLPLIDSIWKLEILLRKTEYHKNNGHKMRYYYYKFKLLKLGINNNMCGCFFHIIVYI